MTGVLVLLVAVVATALVVLLLRRTNGRFRTAAPTVDEEASMPDERKRLAAADIGAPLGERLTLVQFSSAFCSPCRATRTLLADVVSGRPDVEHVEVDAESHLDLVRRLDVRRTPTVVVLDAEGVVVGRASGLPTREQVEGALAAVR